MKEEIIAEKIFARKYCDNDNCLQKKNFLWDYLI